MSTKTPLPSENYAHWAKFRKLRIIEGTWQPFVDPKPAMEHIATLRAAGMSPRTIALMAGLALSTITPLAWPKHAASRAGIRAETSAAILAVRIDLDQIPAGRLISALGTKRRIKALCCIGWTMQHIAQELEISLSLVARTASHADKVTASRARQIRDLYDQLNGRRGPSDICAERSLRKGWAPPAAWDDIDDPTERSKGADKTAARRARVANLAAAGLDVEQIARRLKLKVATVERDMTRGEREVA